MAPEESIMIFSVQIYNINKTSFLHSTAIFFFLFHTFVILFEALSDTKWGHHSQPEFEPWFAMLWEASPFH